MKLSTLDTLVAEGKYIFPFNSFEFKYLSIENSVCFFLTNHTSA